MGRRANIKYFLAPPGQSYCCRCNSYKPTDCFTKNKSSFTGLHWYCKECVVKNDRKYKEKRALRSKSRYGVSEKDYAELLEKQGYVCAICGKPETKIHKGSLVTYSVDHDHETGAVRGLLCSRCNSAIGYFLDNIELLKNAIDYLVKNNTKAKSQPVDSERCRRARSRDESNMRLIRSQPKQLIGSNSDINDLPLFNMIDSNS